MFDATPTNAGDFSPLNDTRRPKDQALLTEPPQFPEAKIVPATSDGWNRAEFPRHLLPESGKPGLMGIGEKGHRSHGRAEPTLAARHDNAGQDRILLPDRPKRISLERTAL